MWSSSPIRYEGIPSSGEVNIESDAFENDQANRSKKNLHFSNICAEFIASTQILFSTKLNWLLLFAPLVLVGSRLKLFGEATSFCFSGLALIPLAERLSLVTEQVAEHTNGTIGALLNATFGNAPEFLISSAALRSGFYRVVQLTLLGSILTNLLFVFGLSCLVGGIQWQTQEIRVTSGNVSISMLLIAAMGLVLPAVLKAANESRLARNENNPINITSLEMNDNDESLTITDVSFSRINAVVMIIMYVAFLIFQLGTHKDEFDYSGNEYAMFGGGHNIVRTTNFEATNQKKISRPNKFCMHYWWYLRYNGSHYEKENDEENYTQPCIESYENNVEEAQCNGRDRNGRSTDGMIEMKKLTYLSRDSIEKMNSDQSDSIKPHKRGNIGGNNASNSANETLSTGEGSGINFKCKLSDYSEENRNDSEIPTDPRTDNNMLRSSLYTDEDNDPMTMRMGIFWLGAITCCVSLMSDIIVDTIDGFAARSNMSEVFASVVIIPYFSNIAEQVSAVIFAYKNKMDLCVGVTIGSAIQIALCVLPGCVLVGWYMDRPMTLYFRIYETVCLLLGVLCMAAVLQGGTTNWIVGVFFIGVYFMIAAGFAYHEQEELSVELV